MKKEFIEIFKLIFVSLCILVLFTGVASLSYIAKFVSVDSFVETQRAATFDVVLNSGSAGFDFNGQSGEMLSENKVYSFSILNNSEVAITYSVKIDFETPPPSYVELYIDDEVNKQSCDGVKTEFIFNGFNYNVGEVEKEHKLNIVVNYVDDEKFMDYGDFIGSAKISVVAEQIS